MTALRSKAYAHKIAQGYVAALLKAAGEQLFIGPHLHPTHHSLLVELLIEREREVLRLLVDGASNREIADHLVLSINTVKKHIFNICSKLSVQGRTQAIAKVRTLNILEH